MIEERNNEINVPAKKQGSPPKEETPVCYFYILKLSQSQSSLEAVSVNRSHTFQERKRSIVHRQAATLIKLTKQVTAEASPYGNLPDVNRW